MRKSICIITIIMFWAAVSAVAQNTLFSKEAKQGGKEYVYDFIERYFKELLAEKNSADLMQKLNDDKVLFVTGSENDIKNLNQNMSFSLKCFDDRYYEATWNDENNAVVSILFPVSYELLLGMNKAEIEKTLYNEIINANNLHLKDTVNEAELKQLPNGLYQTDPKKHFQIESLNNCRYYQKNSSGNYSLVFDSQYLEQSVLNLFQTDMDRNIKIDVEQGVYGLKTKNFTITLKQWISYCNKRSLNIYTAIEEEFETAVKLLVIAESKELGFNHMLSVMIPKSIIDKTDSTVLSAKLNAYIPTHNVKDLYKQYQDKAKRNIKI